MTPTLPKLADDIAAFIRQDDAPEARFNQLALALFAFQFEHNAAYQAWCRAASLSPARVTAWREIPAVPAAAFKELALTVLPPARRTAVFHSSGTTEQRPGRHFHCDESLAVYEASLLEWFEPHLHLEAVPGAKLLFLTPPPEAAPRSSLVHMLATIRRAHPEKEAAFLGAVGADGVWELRLNELAAALDERAPLALFGTAFNFVHLLDHLAAMKRTLTLPPDSRLMETGGYKGRSRVLPREELHAGLSAALGIPRDHIVCEYGMSELSSQAYDGPFGHGPAEGPVGGAHAPSRAVFRAPAEHPAAPGAGDTFARPARAPVGTREGACAPRGAPRIFRFPPWARAQIISPETGREVADGEPGLVQILDLANVASVLAVQTEDLALRRGDGFELLGRAPAAEPRGCSRLTL